MTIKKVWVVLGHIGPERCVCDIRREARSEAKWRNDGPYTWKPYRVVRAELRYPVKGKEKP